MKTISKPSFFLACLSLILATLACNFLAPPPSMPLEVETTPSTETPLPPTNTASPTATPAPTATPTPRGPLTLLTVPQIGPLTRFGRGTIQDIAIHPEGTTLAVASALRVWFYETETLTLIHTLDDPVRNVTNLSWSPDGKLLAFTDDAGTIFIWEAASQTLLQPLIGDVSWVSALSWAPDSQQLAATGEDGKVRIWDTAKGEVIKSIEGYLDYGSGIAWAPDGTSLAFSGYQNQDYTSTIWLWNPDTDEIKSLFAIDGSFGNLHWASDGQSLAFYWGEPCMGGACDNIFVLDVVNEKIHQQYYSISSAWSPDGRLLALGSFGDKIEVFDMATKELVYTLSGQNEDDAIENLIWTQDGRHLISASDEEMIRVWDTTSQEIMLEMADHTQVSEAEWVPDRQILAYKVQNEVHLWNVVTNETILVLPHEQAVESFSFAPDGQQLATYSGDFPQIFNIFEVASNTVVKSWEEESYGWVENITWSPDGQLIAASGSFFGFEYVAGGGVIWNASNGELLFEKPMESFGVMHFWSPDGKLLALIQDDKVHLWDAIRQEERLTLHATDRIGATAWSPDGTKLAVGDESGIITVWDTATLGILYQLEHRPDSGIESLAWSPDGRFLASGGFDDKVQLWDMGQGTLSASLTGHVRSVNALAWFLDSSFLVTGDAEGTIRFFSIPDGALIYALKAHATTLSQLTFSPDGSVIASSAWDGTVQLWGVVETP